MTAKKSSPPNSGEVFYRKIEIMSIQDFPSSVREALPRD
jgi:hypothetical protein